MEEWKHIEEFGNENQQYYISNYGKVKVIYKSGREVIKLGEFNNGGYLAVGMIGEKRKTMRIHRLVGQYFIPNPDNKPHINHIDSVRYNNHYTNLEWVLPLENLIHSVINKRHKTANRIKNIRITNEQIDYIRQSYPDGCSYDYISKVIGLNNKY